MRRAIPYEEALPILERGKYGVLSMADQEGTPYGIPLNYYYDRETNAIYFHCAKKGKKTDILKENPKVSFSVVGREEIIEERYTTHYESVIVTGRAEIISEEAEIVKRLKELCGHLTPTAVTRLDEVIQKSLPAVSIVKISCLDLTGKRNQDR